MNGVSELQSKTSRSALIQTNYGALVGTSRGGCMAYLGIPFAKPPVGELAFKHPLPPDPWQGVLKADEGSCNPIQAEAGFKVGNNSQDCLYLNVFVPETEGSEADGAVGVKTPRPVMVWFYGGSYAQGGAGAVEKGSDELVYDLSLFARETGCVVVSFNYRLNLYGFLNLHCLDAECDANNGLFDQIMALRFVKENIAAFGGDPENITLFGQSAGGACILALMSMPEAQGLFNKTIVQSACIEHFFTEAESERFTKAYMRIAGVKTVAELKALDEEQICEANREYSHWLMMRHGDVRCAFSPIIDGVTLREEPKEAVKRSTITMMIGNTTQEANLFLDKYPDFILPVATKLIHLKVPGGRGSYKQRACDALTTHIYVRPQLEILKDYQGTAYRYVYNHPLPASHQGCFHACELPILFGTKMMGADGALDPFGQSLRAIWGKFAKDSNPGWTRGHVRVIE